VASGDFLQAVDVGEQFLFIGHAGEVPAEHFIGPQGRLPSHTAGPPQVKGIDLATNEWNLIFIDRHTGYINCVFADFHTVRKVGLKELWNLKWHQNFDTAGPWTKAGGADPTDWPDWMTSFKDY